MSYFTLQGFAGFVHRDETDDRPLPAGAVEIKDEHRLALLGGVPLGKVIDWSGIAPKLVNAPAPSEADLKV